MNEPENSSVQTAKTINMPTLRNSFAALLLSCGIQHHQVYGGDYQRYSTRDEFSGVRELLNQSCAKGATVNQNGFICYEKKGVVERRWGALSGTDVRLGSACIELGDLLIGNGEGCHIKTSSDDAAAALAREIGEVAKRYPPEPLTAGSPIVSSPSGAAYPATPSQQRQFPSQQPLPRPEPTPTALLPKPLQIVCHTAEECFQEGTELYQKRNFEMAAEFFKQSYNLAPRQRSRSILLYNTALAYEKAGAAIKAVQYYQLYLQEIPDAKEKEEIERKMPGLRLFAEADALQESNKHREAIKLYQEAYGLLPNEDVLNAITSDMERSYQQLNQ